VNLIGKKILVTGADGFIGSHLCEELVRRNLSVKAFVCYNSFNSYGWLDRLPADVGRHIEIFSGDIRDPNGVREAMRGCSVVLHLAALIAIPYSYHSPDSYVDTNVKGTLNILNAARELQCERVVVTSTSEVYGTAQTVPISETHPLQPQSPYSATKIGADQLALSYFLSFGLPVAILRPFNTYGPRQSARAIIPTVITQIASGADCLKLGSLTPTRDLTYVKDTVRGFVQIAECDAAVGSAVNIGSNFEISVGDLVEKIKSLMGSKIQIISDEVRLRPVNSEVERLLADTSKAKRLFNWDVQYQLDDGLNETINWFKADGNLGYYKPANYNI